MQRPATASNGRLSATYVTCRDDFRGKAERASLQNAKARSLATPSELMVESTRETSFHEGLILPKLAETFQKIRNVLLIGRSIKYYFHITSASNAVLGKCSQ